MFAVILALVDVNMLWYALPLVVAVSLVYAATRHEAMAPILHHAVRVGGYIVGFMLMIFAVLWVMSLFV
jgi:hypothetical protein